MAMQNHQSPKPIPLEEVELDGPLELSRPCTSEPAGQGMLAELKV